MSDPSRATAPSAPASHPVTHTTRRSLVKGMAWAAPAMLVSTAAPAINASLLTCVTLDWAAFPTSGSKLQNGGSMSLGGASVTVRISGSRINHSENFTRSQNALRLRSDNGLLASASDTLQTLRVSFAVPVRHVSLQVFDLDWNTRLSGTQAYRDNVYIPAGAAQPTEIRKGRHVLGAGTPGDPFTGGPEAQGNAPGAPNEQGSELHGVQMAWAGPVDEIQLAYVQGQKAGTLDTPTIWISNVDFCV